jgi:hypothetical protein
MKKVRTERHCVLCQKYWLFQIRERWNRWA